MDDDNLQYEILDDDINNNLKDILNYSFKIILVGDPCVGKSSITLKAIKNEFQEFYNTTVGFEFFHFTIKIENMITQLQIWDTCGQEVYRSLISSFYHSCSLAILVYSVDKKESFNNISFWVNEIKTQSHPDIKMVLVGNKNDLEKREVSYEEGDRFAKENEMEMFLETSAKSGFNVKELFVKIGKMLYMSVKDCSDANSRKLTTGSKLEPKPPKKKEGSGCWC